MDDRDKEAIRRCYVRLEKNLEAAPHLSHLYQDNILSEEDMEKINAKPSTKKQAAKLLKILQRRKNGLQMFIKSLLLTKVQDFLAYELLEVVSWSKKELENFHKEVEGKLDRYQVLKMDMASLQEQYNELKLKYDNLKEESSETAKELNHKVVDLQQQLDDYKHSHGGRAFSPNGGVMRSNSLLSRVFRRKSDRIDNIYAVRFVPK